MNPVLAYSVAALGTAYGLTPEQCDDVHAAMRAMPGAAAMWPSQFIRDFRAAAEKCGIELRTQSGEQEQSN